MRTTITLDDDVHKAALNICRQTGESLGAVVSRLARRGGLRRFPVFDVPPDVPKMSPEAIDKFIEEEGLF